MSSPLRSNMSSANRGAGPSNRNNKRARDDEDLSSPAARPPSSPMASSPPMLPQDEDADMLDEDDVIRDVDDLDEDAEEAEGIDLFADNFENDYASRRTMRTKARVSTMKAIMKK
ncbi:hypothetical protein P3342_000530 [Pyrenophora teres f. teres]|nr:hypothetical protein P3342_000530 [Pyrenophora teres f. teres]